MDEPYSDPYAVLGLTRDATADQVKQSYFTLVRSHPPERDAAAFKRIRGAYERLRDVERRAETDMLLLVTWSGSGRTRRTPALDLTLHREDVLDIARALSDLSRTTWPEHLAKVTL